MKRVYSVLVLTMGCLASCGGHAVLADGAPEAGGPVGLPERRPVAVPVANAGFEDGLDRWRTGGKGFLRAKGAGRNGGDALEFSTAAAAKRPVPSVRQTVEAQPGLYRLRFWLRLRLSVPQTRGPRGARVSLEYYQNGKGQWPNTGPLFGSSDWQQRELLVLLPENIDNGRATISVHRYGKCTGQAWFDDFTLVSVHGSGRTAVG